MTAAEGARGTCLETSVGRGCESCGPSTILVGWFQDDRQGAGRGEGEARSRSLTSFGMTTAGGGGGGHFGPPPKSPPHNFPGKRAPSLFSWGTGAPPTPPNESMTRRPRGV